jgi:hypothetical protein
MKFVVFSMPRDTVDPAELLGHQVWVLLTRLHRNLHDLSLFHPQDLRMACSAILTKYAYRLRHKGLFAVAPVLLDGLASQRAQDKQRIRVSGEIF